MEFENSHQRQVEQFSRAALDELRSGRHNEEVSALRDSMTAQIPRWVQSPGVESPWVLRAIRLLSDLHDRRGDNHRALECIAAVGTPKEIEASISRRRSTAGPLDTERYQERSWCLLQAATCLHRLGKSEEAEELAKMVLGRLANESSPEMLELRIRANYIEGRILQTSGRPESSQDYLGAALECCDAWVAPGVDPATAAGYARYQSAIVLSALARSSLAKNELTRAGRQLLIASTILRDTDDEVTRTYVKFLSGCVKRQTNQLPDAIRQLSAARAEFLGLRHTRLYNRCSLELGQAFYNCESYDKLKAVLAQWEKDRAVLGDHDGEDNQAGARWDAARRLLLARTHLKQNSLRQAAAEAARALETLERSDPKSRPQVWDRLAIAYAILAETALGEGHFDECITLANQGMKVRNGSPPSDAADHAWLLMVVADAHFKRSRPGDIALAHRYLRECQGLVIENDFMKKRLTNLAHSLDFFIAHDERAKLKYSEWDLLLKSFLLRRAEAVHPGASAEILADVLGVSKQTVYNWQRDIRQHDQGQGGGSHDGRMAGQ